MDEVILPFLKTIGKGIKKIVGPRLDKLMKDVISMSKGEKGIGEVLADNATTIVGAIALYYSRSIAAFALAFGTALVPSVAKAVGNLTSMIYYGQDGKPKKGSKVKRGFGTKLAGVGRVVGVIALLSMIYEGAAFAFEEGVKRRAKEEEEKSLADIRRDNSLIPDPMVFISGVVGGLYKGMEFLSGKIIGLLYGKDAEKQAMEHYNKSDARESLLFFFDNMFSEIKRYLGIMLKSVLGIFAPKTLADMEKDLFKMQEDLIDRKKQLMRKRIKFGGREERNIYEQQQIDDLEKLIEEDNLLMRKQLNEMILRFPEREKELNQMFESMLEGDPYKDVEITTGKYVDEKYHGGGLRKGSLALIGETAHGRGGELVYTGSDAMVMNQSRTDALLSMALEKGLSGGGEDVAPIVVSSDNSVRSNISNMTSTSTVVTSNDSFTNAIVSSV